MDPVTIPLSAVAYQQIKAPLSGQSVALTIQQRTNGLYMDVILNGVQILAGVLCQDRTWLARKPTSACRAIYALWTRRGRQIQSIQALGVGMR